MLSPSTGPVRWRSWLIAALLLLPFAHAETIEGRVAGVADGDTITVLDAQKISHKIRLAGIDAPEKRQAFGNRSKESLSDLVFEKAVVIQTSKIDKYGRQVGKVMVDGLDANLAQLRRGMAWFYRQYERELSIEDRSLYEAAEREARQTKIGLWSDPESLEPWNFRRVPENSPVRK